MPLITVITAALIGFLAKSHAGAIGSLAVLPVHLFFAIGTTSLTVLVAVSLYLALAYAVASWAGRARLRHVQSG
jgi:hypothetical protein